MNDKTQTFGDGGHRSGRVVREAGDEKRASGRGAQAGRTLRGRRACQFFERCRGCMTEGEAKTAGECAVAQRIAADRFARFLYAGRQRIGHQKVGDRSAEGVTRVCGYKVARPRGVAAAGNDIQ